MHFEKYAKIIAGVYSGYRLAIVFGYQADWKELAVVTGGVVLIAGIEAASEFRLPRSA